jgi:BirA family biotin operon repressor/biotin-[acetyl-CoA-carboxylase] ligase
MSRSRERWIVLDVATSTNDTIHEAAERGEPEGTIHVARTQTRGRGRSGRVWWSPPGAGLWMSVLLRPTLSASAAPGLALVAGRAVREALQPVVKTPIELRWPNDLVARGRKLGGILAELRSRGENYWIALGIGINIDHRRVARPETLRDLAVDLVELGGRELEPLALGRRITSRLWPLYRRYLEGEAIPALVGDHLAHVGRRVTVVVSPGERVEGVVSGLGAGGELLVRDAGGVDRTIRAGDVTYHDGG